MNFSDKTFYHGSNRLFDIFDANKSYGSKRRFVIGAFWFSDSLKVARSYGKYIYEVNLKTNNSFFVDANFENFCEIYLSHLPWDIGLQIDVLDNKKAGDTINYIKYQQLDDPEFSLRFDTSDLALAARRAKYDSLVVQNVIDAGSRAALKEFATTVAVFDINQIVINNVKIKDNAK
jgi:hypothetical protein